MPNHYHPNYFSTLSHPHSHASFQKTHHYHPSAYSPSITVDTMPYSTTKDHSYSVAAIIGGSILIFSALTLPMHCIISVAFVLAMVVVGACLIGKGIKTIIDDNQPQQSDGCKPSMF